MPRDKYKASTIYARYATAGNKVCHNFVTFRKKIITCRFFGIFVLLSVLIIFFSVVPPTEPCTLRSTQPLKVSTRDFSWVKGGRCVWLTTYNPCSAETSRKSGILTYPEPFGSARPVAEDLNFTFNKLLK